MAGWLGRLAGWGEGGGVVDSLVGWVTDWMHGLFGWVAGWLVGLVGWVTDRIAWLVD